ncbi:DUF1272 domain-containing protein [Kordiimonas sp. SCSIO 12610]|uniref:DUF1272 domain-containing protein n=1 Tax=Kordiimonas sp. SCSIO 12610 TaxID=2829597 RepID=UPI002109E00F|nr:DUF1272 domain-containing protein [Kordiimonas sp. SCSIO 12610]UTW55238.1 DUF1272 domain-containing protein [Kordiimonas sp. SCSIO 12610]
MLQLRPNCEHCDKNLPTDSGEAMICSYECTFCIDCVDAVLENVCPNCGGGFVKRPIRPRQEWRKGVSRDHQLPNLERVHKPVDVAQHKKFAGNIKDIDPQHR